MIRAAVLSAVYIYVALTIFLLLSLTVRPDCPQPWRIMISFKIAVVWPVIVPFAMFSDQTHRNTPGVCL